MPILNSYSRRKRQRKNSGRADVYRYDEIPPKLRGQIVDIWRWATGPATETIGGLTHGTESWPLWESIAEAIRHEKGLQRLARGLDPFQICANYFLSSNEIEDVLDVLEIAFQCISDLGDLSESARRRRQIEMTAQNAIEELNFRLREAGVGYQFESGEIIEVDSQYIHAESVRPALTLLSDSKFLGPHQEFLHAHERYRKARSDDSKDLEDAIATALKAYESTLKVICGLKHWPVPANATAAPLVQIVVEKGLVPVYLKSSLESLATLSNRTSRHGQGAKVRETPKYFAAYALHQVAANIVMLIEAFNASA